MSQSLNFINELVGHDQAPLYAAGLVIGVTGVVGVAARYALKKKKNPLVPDKGLSLSNLFEIIAGFMIWLGDSAMGEENRKYLPFAATVFFYVLSMNLLGLIPGFVMPTDQFQFNLGIALSVFVLYNYWGIREVGIKNYIKHMWGPIFLVGFLLFPVELISHLVRPLTLSLRLFGNMTGDHLALAVFTDLTKIIVPVIFYTLGTVVCFVQAFVFALLTMIYIRLAVTHEEDH